MKKILALVLSLMMIISITAACSSEGPGEATPAASEAPASAAEGSTEEWTKDTPMKIGFSQNQMAHPFRVAGWEQLQAYVEEQGLNWELILTDGGNDATKQTADIEDLISQGVDAIIACPVTADTMGTAAQAVMDAGIPLVLTNRQVTNGAFTVAVTGSNYQIGEKTAHDMAERLGGVGRVAMIEGTLGASDTIDRTAGFVETLENEYPDLELVTVGSGDYKRDLGMAAMEDILIVEPDLDAVFCQNDEMAQGALEAAKAAGREDLLIYGNDCYESTLDLIGAGEIAGTTAYPTSVQSAVDVLVQIFENGGVWDGEKELIDDVPMATPENYEEFYDLALDA